MSADSIHTNSVEGFWALLKRGIKGNFHWLSKKHLSSYVKEFEFRYNNRENEMVFSDVLGGCWVCSYFGKFKPSFSKYKAFFLIASSTNLLIVITSFNIAISLPLIPLSSSR